MKVRVVRCENPVFWYRKHIGEIFDIEDESSYLQGLYYHLLIEDRDKSSKRFILAGEFEVVLEIDMKTDNISELFEEKVKQIHNELHNQRGTPECEECQ